MVTSITNLTVIFTEKRVNEHTLKQAKEEKKLLEHRLKESNVYIVCVNCGLFILLRLVKPLTLQCFQEI